MTSLCSMKRGSNYIFSFPLACPIPGPYAIFYGRGGRLVVDWWWTGGRLVVDWWWTGGGGVRVAMGLKSKY